MVTENYTKIARGIIEYTLDTGYVDYQSIDNTPIKINYNLTFTPVEIFCMCKNCTFTVDYGNRQERIENPLLSTKTSQSKIGGSQLALIKNITNKGFTITIDSYGTDEVRSTTGNKKINIEWIAIG